MTLQMNYPYLDTSLTIDERVSDLLSRLTLDEKIALMPTRQAAVPRLGLEEVWVGGEAAHGIVNRGGIAATVFPQPIGLANTWNTELMHRIGSVIGDEARALNNEDGRHGLMRWAPTIDMERDPRWGRNEEAYGEDPHLTGKLAASLIRGMQGDHDKYVKLVASPKHFYGNNNEVGRLDGSSSIDPRNRREYYLKAFEPAFTEGGALSIMTAYNEINGTPALEHADIRGVLKNEWGLRGFTVCDGGDLSQTVDFHNRYESHAESAAAAIKAGIDTLTDDAKLVCDAVREALERELLTEADLDEALTNMLRVRYMLGMMDPPEGNPYKSIPMSVVASKEHGDAALQAARESIVLLRNENNLLPLSAEKLPSAAVIGPLADHLLRGWYCGDLPYAITPLEGIQARLGSKTVSKIDGLDRIGWRSLRNGQYLKVREAAEGEKPGVAAASAELDGAEIFAHNDWGWNAHTFLASSNGKFVSTETDKKATASADEVFGWFVKESFQLVPQSSDDSSDNAGKSVYRLLSWNGQPVATADNGELVVGEKTAELDSSSLYERIVLQDGAEEAAQAATQAAAAIVFVGNNPVLNGKEEIDRPGLELPLSQERLIRRVAAANPNTIVVIVGSYPYALGDLAELVQAIVYMPHGGQEAGTAIAEALFGDYAPAGRLPMTWYASEDQLPSILEYDIRKGKRTYQYFDGEPLYPFGYGLTYSPFEYRELAQSSTVLQGAEDVLELSFTIENVGSLASDEVPQLYVRAEQSSVERPIKQLRGFTRVRVEAGAGERITFRLPASELAFWDVSRERYCVESGEYTLLVGRSSTDIRLSARMKVEGEIVPPRGLFDWTWAENYNEYESVRLEECREGGTAVAPVDGAGWVRYDQVDFEAGVSLFEAKVSAGESRGGTITVRLDAIDGPVAAVYPITSTGGWHNWMTISGSVESFSGQHTVFVQLEGAVRLNRLRFLA
ncbi:glucan 1,4-alpha-glucosidase [Paenibacillus sp. CCS19]|uniref:glycoside hydrolase family 3 protein n=1 Tax=Paenibacillus sp. CCS19 TaxID=3158387 RepID=UPI00256C808D|nr:glycoside hydrolase family 3 protein [Paenibacillus cellulosilyticus]GMK39937.1 glucan 1,4-alpha-glucosidase [Paenibacillus cellulosilyticus]